MLKWIDVLRFASKGNPAPSKRIEKTEEEWKKLLTPEQFSVARKKGTERAFTGEYCEAHDPGLYACRCCGTLLFDSTLKFESGTGWPSYFYADHAISGIFVISDGIVFVGLRKTWPSCSGFEFQG